MEKGYVGEKPIRVEQKSKPTNGHVHKCPKCGEWICEASFCRKYAGMRVWCDHHDWMD